MGVENRATEASQERRTAFESCAESQVSAGRLVPRRFLKNQKRGHFVLPEKGNPLKRAVDRVSEAKGRVSEAKAVESLHNPLSLGKAQRPSCLE